MTAAHDLRELVERFEARVARYALGPPGAYRRFSQQDAPDPYGCAAAANILYTTGRLPRDPAVRSAWVGTIQGLQDAESGLFREDTHHPIHTTAHCLGALELFDARARHPLRELAPLGEPAAMEAFLDRLDWAGSPWTEAHKGAGLYAALVLSGEASEPWQERYLDWLAREFDPRTGLLRRGAVPPPPDGAAAWFPHLAGTFHYLFDLEHARRPLPHPEALVDTCLEIQAGGHFPLAHFVGFAEIDWVYCLSRALRQSGHRFAEARRALRAFAKRYVDYLTGLDFDADDGARDLHRLFGALCALAELQAALPGELHSARPLRLVLDRRPFI